ncbi:MAG: prolyl aminopeptidase [Nocardioides sp.]
MYSITEPHESGLLPVGDGQHVHWEVCGNPAGRPAVVLHGGPGSGAAPWWRRYFDPTRYRVVLLDQRGCGRSTPYAGEPVADLTTNTTGHLIADLELLREHLGIERWLVFGGSWGSTLGLAYAVEHPDRVTELVLWGVVTTRAFEVDWLTHQMGKVFPQEYDALLAALPEGEGEGNVPLAFNRLLMSPDPAVHDPAARAWCAWEDRLSTLSGTVSPSQRYEDPRFRLCFARLVTHYFGNHGFLPDDAIVGRLDRIAHLPAVLVRGRLDLPAPLRSAYEVARRLPRAEFHVVEDGGHGAGDEVLVAATDRFAH